MKNSNIEKKKFIAWGQSKILQLHLQHHPLEIEFCVDVSAKPGFPLKVVHPDEVNFKDYVTVIFAVSNAGLAAIKGRLSARGLNYGKDFIYYSDLYEGEISNRSLMKCAFEVKANHFLFATAFTLNSLKPVHTTIPGSAILLGIVDKLASSRNLTIAEMGSFEGGNVYSIMTYLAAKDIKPAAYYVFDSFEGFPDLTEHDPQFHGKGAYKTEKTYQEIRNDFSIYPEVKVIKGFVPSTFDQIAPGLKFDVVFYDCDLYQPALDTLDFFWDRMNPGGYIVLHDYAHEPGGFAGVEKAWKDFSRYDSKAAVIFWEGTMAVIQR